MSINIGIDPGAHTGIAVWDGDRFTIIETLPLHRALLRVKFFAELYAFNGNGVTAYFEDARQRKWYGHNTASRDRARLQGAGSVKRDCTIWEDALLEWIEETRAVPHENAITRDLAFQEVVNKLNSM